MAVQEVVFAIFFKLIFINIAPFVDQKLLYNKDKHKKYRK